MSADNVRGWEIVPKNEYLWDFEDKLSAKDIISQHPGKPTKGVYFITLPLIFISYLNRSQKAGVDLKTIGAMDESEVISSV